MNTSNPSAEYFNRIAGDWDTLRAGYFPEAVRDIAIKKAYLRKEMTVADVGAGTGFMSAGLAPLVEKVHLLDGSAAMLNVARKYLADFQNLVFHETDGQILPLPDSSMDVVFANMYLHHCPEPQAAIREMVRILKPTGRLIISDLEEHDYTWLKTEMADVWLGFQERQLRSWYREADLVNIIIDKTGDNCCAGSGGTIQGTAAEADIPIQIAVGTKRMAMRESVQDAYGARAEMGGNCCGTVSGKPHPAKSSCCGESSPSTIQGTPKSTSSCCQKETGVVEEVNFSTDYTQAEKSSVPAEAEDISLGCGNPTAMANLKPGEIVLDIGSGGGMDSFLASKQVGETGYVIGVDMTPAMVNRARATAMKSGITNVEFRLGQAEAIPVDTNSVDVILSNCVINLCEDKGLVFQEAFRVLKPGGRLELSDMVTDKAFPVQDKLSPGEWSGCVSGALPEMEYLDLIEQAGFSSIRSRRSNSSGMVGDVNVFSSTVSAVKPGGKNETKGNNGCGCSSGCCN